MQVMLRNLATSLLVFVLVVLTGCGNRPGGVMVEETGGGSVTVLVTYGEQPAPGAIVQLLDSRQTPVAEVRTDEEGNAIFKGVPSGSGYQAIATLEGVTGSATVDVAGGDTKTKVVLSQRSGPVGLVVGSVKIAGADKPLANVVVEVAGKKATTDANGQFRLEGVPAGPATVKATLGGYGSTSEALVVKPGSSSAVAIALQPLATGPKAGRTLVTTPGQILEIDTWQQTVGTFGASQAWSAVFLADGAALVADAGGDKVVEFGDGGAKRATYTARAVWQLGFGGVQKPKGASRTPSGNILVADTGNDRVVEIDKSNKIVWEYKGVKAPRWAERLPKGNTLIADSGRNRVIEVDGSGRIVWGLGDGSADVLNNPSSAQRLPNGNTLVCDAGNSRVMEVNAQNQLVWMVPGRGGDAGNLNNPGSAKRLATGNTLIADTDNNRVVELSPEGSVVWKASVNQPVFADRF